MKCLSRSTLGVIIGLLNILIYIILCFALIAILAHFDQQNDHIENKTSEQMMQAYELNTYLLSTILTICLTMIIISGVLIMGIVNRRYKLMIPWLFLSGLGFICHCGRILLTLLIHIINGLSFSAIISKFVLNILGCGIEALILWPIYTLWRDIRLKNKQNSERLMNDGVHYEKDLPPSYNYCENLMQKS